MALTKNEALERIAAIWCNDYAKEMVTLEPDGGVFIDREGSVSHRLDNNGHPVCHDVCKKLEAIAYEKKWLR